MNHQSELERKAKQYDLAMEELKKHLTSLHKGETLVGAIRNLAQGYVGYKQRTAELEAELSMMKDVELKSAGIGRRRV